MKIFLKKQSNIEIPTLYYSDIFVESIRPLLFSCIDDEKKLYLCVCRKANGDGCQWTVCEVNAQTIIDMLRNRIPIYDAFKKHEKNSYYIEMKKGNEIIIQKKNYLKDEFLPQKEAYIDADKDEYENEITSLIKLQN